MILSVLLIWSVIPCHTQIPVFGWYIPIVSIKDWDGFFRSMASFPNPLVFGSFWFPTHVENHFCPCCSLQKSMTFDEVMTCWWWSPFFCCWFSGKKMPSEKRRARPIEMTSIPNSPDSCNYSCVSSGSLLAHAGNTEVPEKGGRWNIWETWNIFAWVDWCFFFLGMILMILPCFFLGDGYNIWYVYIYIYIYICINVISNQPLPWDGIGVFFMARFFGMAKLGETAGDSWVFFFWGPSWNFEWV